MHIKIEKQKGAINIYMADIIDLNKKEQLFIFFLPFILLRLIKSVPKISGNLVVKSKLPPRSGASLEAVEPHP